MVRRHDVAEMCKRCLTCQKMAQASFRKAKLVQFPVIEVPFIRIAMDMVGPLPRTEESQSYILTIKAMSPDIPMLSLSRLPPARI